MKRIAYLTAVLIVAGFIGFSFKSEAGSSKEFEAEKGVVFENGSAVSFQESMEQREEQESVFRKELLESNRQTIELLKDIRNILKEIKEEGGSEN